MSYNVPMKKVLLFFLAAVVFGGCFNERGISLRYYNDCEEYYDVQGYYHTKCDRNLLDYADIPKAFQPRKDPRLGSVE